MVNYAYFVDVLELIAMLQESENFNICCSKMLRMLASRACRNSIMIGTALSHAEMSKIVLNLATLKKPWNCPHGRPTVRYLCPFK